MGSQCLMCTASVPLKGATCGVHHYKRLIKYLRANGGKIPKYMDAPLDLPEQPWAAKYVEDLMAWTDNIDWNRIEGEMYGETQDDPAVLKGQ